ncbi:MAG TPA: TonB-dependent receptor plug domain-containing protein, partial [Nitrospirales bacterium]|nr:TonB-dependent receptor plug domain-containing protein [Nitrospirales bacterium]
MAVFRVILALLAAPVCALAADPEPPVTAPDVVISATRTPVASIAVPQPATVVTKTQADRTPFRDGHQVDDLLRYVPEVQPSNLSSRYNHPTAQALSLRGLGSRRALVLMDGVPLNDGFGGWINWGLVPNAVERIEVVPGGGSNLYGTWAMGGVVQILTEAPSADTGARVDARAGSLGTHSDSVTARYGTDRAGAVLSGRWFQTNGFYTVPAYQRGPIDRRDGSRHEEFHGRAHTALGSRID